ncbi:MAG TPA: OsmC family protein [Bacillales bacterium]|nr:OsmC family protein [Bacillales bacterium]
MAEHTFHYEGSWSGGRQGKGHIQSGNLSSVLSTPKQMDGLGEGTNPDELLVSAAGSCYLMTLAFGIERKGVPVKELTITSMGIASDKGGLHFERIIHHPRIVLEAGADDDLIEKVEELVKASESRCMVSKALRGNVDVSVEAEIVQS